MQMLVDLQAELETTLALIQTPMVAATIAAALGGLALIGMGLWIKFRKDKEVQS